ncbi:MAG: twin-arginine translocation signal domain-containing protein, partial [Gammaproteobacteria bacterium]|nr:twin-arginine translocation signal domain-containing protein [Gammaproteobacteria bacterium]
MRVRTRRDFLRTTSAAALAMPLLPASAGRAATATRPNL